MFRLLFPAFFLLMTGCASYKIPTSAWAPQCPSSDAPSIELQCRSIHHPLYQVIPRHRSQIRPYDLGHWTTWTLFGNDEDGIFGEDGPLIYLPNKQPSTAKATRWWLRNPLHNFCFHVIGSGGRNAHLCRFLYLSPTHFELMQCYPTSRCAYKTDRSHFALSFHDYKPFIKLWLNLPCKRQFKFYFGWREKGNFGIKLQPFSRKRSQSFGAQNPSKTNQDPLKYILK